MKNKAWKEKAAKLIFTGASSTAILIVLLIFLFLFKEAIPFIKDPGISKLFDTSWRPVSFQQESYGLAPLITGSFLVTILATIIAIPFGVIGAVYISEVSRKSEREFLDVISSESDRLSNLVNNLLDLSQLESGSLRLSLLECPVEEMLTQAARNAPLEEGNIFTYEMDSDLPALYADPPRLEMILRNLIQNAVKYAGTDAEIHIQVTGENNMIVFRVYDNGPGIPVENSSRVFESFYRLDNGLRRTTSGAGLGLTICQGLVRAHGGEIWVEPQEIGTCLAFSIPVRNEPMKEENIL